VRPLDRLPSIKLKLGVVIVAAVLGTVVAIGIGWRAGLNHWASGVIAAVVALGLIQILARGMTSPLREMAGAARAMAKGDYGRRVTATSRDEVGELAHAFNRMAAELAEVDRTRKDLIANVSHELRTPVSALQAMLENLIDGIGTPDEGTLETMLQQVQRLSGLVTQLLDLSRLESGVLQLHRQRFPLDQMLDAVRRDVALAARREGRAVAIEVEVAPPDLTLEADEQRMHQVVANLLDNAVRHSPEAEPVNVVASQVDGSVVIEVLDRGPGIAPDEIDRVFQRNYRPDGANGGGSGLGLAIARWIVELHGGDISARANEPGGCRMVVQVPERAATR
jgi:signal transduction histidine kinase